MKTMKKTLAIMLVIGLLIALAACTGATTTTTAGTTAATTAGTTAGTSEGTTAATTAGTTEATTTAGPDISEKVDLVFYVMGDAPAGEVAVETAINEKLMAKLNCTVDFRFSTWTDWKQKYNTELTSGGADLIYTAGWLDYGLLANSGAYEELDTLLDTYAPDLKALVGEANLNMCRVGGELYSIPNNWPEYVPSGIVFREDLRAKYDLPRPDSLENMEAFFLGIKQNEPEQGILRVTAAESQGLFYGFDAAHVLAIKYPWTGMEAYGLVSDYATPADVYDYWYSDDFVTDVKMLKRWADQGFWSKSALSDTNDTEAYVNGLAVADVAGRNPNKFITTVNDTATTHPDWKHEYIAYGEITGVLYPGHATQNATAIVRGSKYPERAMMVLNYMMTDEEMNRLVQAGVEGVHYELSADGLYKNLSEDFKYENYNTWSLRVNDFKLLQESDVVLQAMFDKYAAVGAMTKFPNINIAGGFTENYEDYSTERTAVTNVVRQYLAPLQAGLVTDVDAAIAEFRAKATEAGVDVCRDGFKTQWEAYCTEYGYK